MHPLDVVILLLRLGALIMLSVFSGDYVSRSINAARIARQMGVRDSDNWARAAIFLGLTIANSLLMVGLLFASFYPAGIVPLRVLFALNSTYILLSLSWYYYLKLG